MSLERPEASPAAAPRSLRIAYTPDSDDAFNFYAWQHGRVELPGWSAGFHHGHIIALNRAAARGEYDVVAISSVVYPSLADRYWILSVGNSVGRGYGPVLVSEKYRRIEELAGKRVAVAGVPTTGGALALMFCPGAEFVEMPYDQIADAVKAGRCDAGVMIHEELLFFPQKGLQAVADLGAEWTRSTGLPLPVGLNVAARSLGRDLARRIVHTCRASLQWGLEHREEAMSFAGRFGRGCCQRHVDLFCNTDTVRLQPEVIEALKVMFARVADLNLGPRLETFEVLDE